VKIVIGITQYPEKIEDFITLYQGEIGSVTEVGPFLSEKEALVWLDCLKSKIGEIEEMPREQHASGESVYYGFTFERAG
jgi:hypothetical protein